MLAYFKFAKADAHDLHRLIIYTVMKGVIDLVLSLILSLSIILLKELRLIVSDPFVWMLRESCSYMK